jgi:hypothetical protein
MTHLTRLLFVPCLVCACTRSPLKPTSTSDISLGIMMSGGGVFVPARIAGKPVTLLLDSGFEETVIDRATARSLGLAQANERSEDAPGGKVEVTTVVGARVEVAGMPLPLRDLTAVDLSGFDPVFGRHIDGALGYDFFAGFVLTLDYEHRRLILHDSRSFKTTLAGVSVNLASKQPYIDATLTTRDGRRIAASLEVDTGKLDPLSLTAAFARKHRLLDDTRALLPFKGVSLGGETQAWLTRAGSVEFADTVLKNPLLGIADDSANRDGQLGYEALKRFTITFDYAHRKLYFAPNATLTEPFEFDHAGMIIGATPPDFRALTIFLVVADTPAAKAGLQSGDTIVSVNGRSARDLTVDQARQYFQKVTGGVNLIIKRENREIPVSLNCHSLI